MALKNKLRAGAPKPLRVGFDFDGVIMYNPARIVRRPVQIFKHRFFPKVEKKFYIPSSRLEKALWHMFHWSSIVVAGGYKRTRGLRDNGIIEPYIVSARYGFLRPDFERWLRHLKADHFKGTFMNDKNEQPHKYKERMIKELGLDVFIEDNWNIVDHLRKNTSAHILWIYNILDTSIDYPLKFPSLDKAIDHIEKELIHHGKKK